MKISLDKTIKELRKTRGMTQEQLAEAMGVSIGAVSKWENGLARPDIELLPELADFFEISVDVLLGYQWKQQTVKKIIEDIKQYTDNKEYEKGCVAAHKFLQKYPNQFDVVYQSARLFNNYGLELHDKDGLNKALHLYQHAIELIDQNTDTTISGESIQIQIGLLYATMEENEQAVNQLKKYNVYGVMDAHIGQLLAVMGQSEKALDSLSDNLISCITNLFIGAMGMINSYTSIGKKEKAIEVIDWTIEVIEGLNYKNQVSYLDKMIVMLLTAKALYVPLEEASSILNIVKLRALQFDETPTFRCSSIRFYEGKDRSFYDDIGRTAMECITAILEQNEEENRLEYLTLWRTIIGEGYETE